MAASVWTSIVLWALLRMYRGYAWETTVFSSEGQKVTLPCHRTSTNCSSTTWNHNRDRTIQIVGYGMVRENLSGNITKRLTVEPNCSLTILNVTPADAGRYNCRVYNDLKNHDDSLIHLTVLSITSSQLKPETLNCSLHTYEICTKHIQNDMNLIWLKGDGSDLKQDTRYNITQSRCHSTLTGTLDQSDHNGKWTCQLTVDGKLESSASYITSLSESGTAIGLPIRLAVFFFILALPLIIGAVIYTRKRTQPIRDQVSSGTELHEYVNTNNKP
ncbi:uncharacterized protein LOC125708137 [Brienomyrus brachyistius]|uniref:uncharacterized protein LOC125708137 n=1 Tax=Brienomyrus brachyistius TaxID=42636 RepID=UPI0020B267D7|nr:uncharacterized protein LOC125708137 [Brienomyrus brachyistius]